MKNMNRRRWISACLAALAVLSLTSCGLHGDPQNLISQEREEKRAVNLFSPMEKTDPDAENVARTASDITVAMAEEKLGVTMVYRTYTADNYQDLEILTASDYPEAVRLADERSGDRDVVILSPASTSFDRFRNFEERGQVFKNLVMALPE